MPDDEDADNLGMMGVFHHIINHRQYDPNSTRKDHLGPPINAFRKKTPFDVFLISPKHPFFEHFSPLVVGDNTGIPFGRNKYFVWSSKAIPVGPEQGGTALLRFSHSTGWTTIWDHLFERNVTISSALADYAKLGLSPTLSTPAVIDTIEDEEHDEDELNSILGQNKDNDVENDGDDDVDVEDGKKPSEDSDDEIIEIIGGDEGDDVDFGDDADDAQIIQSVKEASLRSFAADQQQRAKAIKKRAAEKADGEKNGPNPKKKQSVLDDKWRLDSKKKADSSVSDTKKAKPSPPNELEPPEDDDVIEIIDSDDASDEDASAPAAAAAESPEGRTMRSLQGYTVTQLKEMFRKYSGGFPDKKSTDGYRLSVLDDGWLLDGTGEHYSKRFRGVMGWTTLMVKLI